MAGSINSKTAETGGNVFISLDPPEQTHSPVEKIEPEPTSSEEKNKNPTQQTDLESTSQSGNERVSSDGKDEIQCWNKPRGNIPRLGFAFISFIIAGMNDAAIGALIPYLENYYNLTYTIVSLIFLTPFVGYAIAAFTNARIHTIFGQRGVAIMAPLCHFITYIILSQHPPFPVLVVINMFSGFGNGLTDACFCAWIGVMDKANTIQGFLHSCYSIGALLAPLIATEMVVTAKLPWFYFYYVMVGMAVLEFVGLTVTFWRRTGAVYREAHKDADEHGGAGTRVALKSKVTWLCASFLFAYMGIEVGLGGWITTFSLRVRKASPYASGLASTGFWAGQAAGRASLGFVTERYGERLCVTVFLALCLALQLVFWLVPHFIVSAIAAAFLGVFLGPLFPSAVMVTAKLLPTHIHVSAIGFAMATGGTGGTVFPFIIGAIASKKGVGVLQPVILALIIVMAGIWFSFPKIKKQA